MSDEEGTTVEALRWEVRFQANEAAEWKKLSNSACEALQDTGKRLKFWRSYAAYATGAVGFYLARDLISFLLWVTR